MEHSQYRLWGAGYLGNMVDCTTDMNRDFYYERTGRYHLLLRGSQADVVRNALLDGRDLTPLDVDGGRGTVWTFPLDTTLASELGLLRAYRRGGVLRHCLKDGYFGVNRPLREFFVHRYAEARGLPVPSLLGVRWTVTAGCFYRHGALATQLLPDARSLDTVLAAGSEMAMRQAREAGALIRRMHDQGIWHADLNVRNLLFTAAGPHLLDFDNARIRSRLSTRARARNLLRLQRSMNKADLPAAYFDALMQGYGGLQLPGWLQRAYRWKWALSDMLK